jgi:hypothetical protein
MPTGFAHGDPQSDVDLANKVVDASRSMVRFQPTRNIFIERRDQTQVRFHR